MKAIKIGQCKEGRRGALEMCFQSRFQDPQRQPQPDISASRSLAILKHSN